jgi:hypothetical protein
VILLLRKSIFLRESECRKMAILGFLQILESLGQKEGKVGGGEEKLGCEIIGFLRRCFNQQSEMREEVYNGLSRVFECNINLREVIIDILSPQFWKYFNNSENELPVSLSACIDGKPTAGQVDKGPSSVRIAEPFHCLIMCMAKCASYCTPDSEDTVPNSVYLALQKLLNTILDRMVAAELTDFEIDKQSVFKRDSTEGSYNQHAAIILLGVYAALIEYCISQSSISSSYYAKVDKLFKCSIQLKGIIKENTGIKPGKRAKKQQQQQTNVSFR